MPLSDNTRQAVSFGAPIPGQSLTSPPKNNQWEHPPQFVKLSDSMHYIMDQLTEPMHLKALLQMMEAGMPIEAITRTLIFTGFATGKWTVDLAILMYKPLMLSLISIAHRAGLKDTPLVMPKALMQKDINDLKTHMMMSKVKDMKETALAPVKEEPPKMPTSGKGFMARNKVA